jgi:enoyl-CoA hydratase/carnithine racemase
MPERVDGASEWLPAVVGRSRALEITIGANDFDADTAERYGLVNRSIPNAQLDGFVDGLARRIASYQTRTIELAKKTINARLGVPAEADRWASNQSFQVAIGRPETQTARLKPFENGFQQPGESELRMGANASVTSTFRKGGKHDRGFEEHFDRAKPCHC